MKIAAAILFLVLLDFGSCPHDAVDPIAEPSNEALDGRLLGTWRCIAGDDEPPSTVVVSRNTPSLFEAVVDVGKGPARLRLHSATAGAERLVNFESTEADEKKKWGLARMTLHRSTVLQIELAREAPFENTASAQSRDVVLRSLKRGDLFADLWICARIEGEKSHQ